jgi:PAS domain-containing protein
VPIAVYTTDAAGRIKFYNEAAAAFWGYRPELGKSEWCGMTREEIAKFKLRRRLVL